MSKSNAFLKNALLFNIVFLSFTTIAQEIEEIIPEVVQENKDLNSDKMIKSVDYSKMVAVLIKAIQEQQVQIDELKTQIGE